MKTNTFCESSIVATPVSNARASTQTGVMCYKRPGTPSRAVSKELERLIRNLERLAAIEIHNNPTK